MKIKIQDAMIVKEYKTGKKYKILATDENEQPISGEIFLYNDKFPELKYGDELNVKIIRGKEGNKFEIINSQHTEPVNLDNLDKSVETITPDLPDETTNRTNKDIEDIIRKTVKAVIQEELRPLIEETIRNVIKENRIGDQYRQEMIARQTLMKAIIPVFMDRAIVVPRTVQDLKKFLKEFIPIYEKYVKEGKIDD